MRRVYRYLAIIVIILVTAGMLAAFIPDTVLYSLETDTSSSRFHDNVDALKVQSVNSTTDVMPDLQGLLDSPSPIMLNIRIRDVDEARRELALLAKNNIRVNNLIVNLDMSDSAIQDLSKNSVKQRELLQDLLNSSISLDALNNLEIQYRDQNRPNLQVSVQYQKEEILKKINNLRDQYPYELLRQWSRSAAGPAWIRKTRRKVSPRLKKLSKISIHKTGFRGQQVHPVWGVQAHQVRGLAAHPVWGYRRIRSGDRRHIRCGGYRHIRSGDRRHIRYWECGVLHPESPA